MSCEPAGARRPLAMHAVALISGGLDSATAAAMAAADGYTLYGLTICYGQRHLREVDAARAVAAGLGVREHKVVDIALREIGGSALTADIPVPEGRSAPEMAAEIPITYVPARNTIFLAVALGYAEVVGAETLVLGVNQVDYSGYPDCREEFLRAFETLANLATKAGVDGAAHFRIYAPLLHRTKAEIIRAGRRLGVDYGRTWSCYAGGDVACGRCDSCLLRRAGFREAGVRDPLPYAES
ncbi:MAG TPA: 7-cyano-7-deazaguanine synthase QueC [Armatimonadota bacterium]|nr:7-cyano-7-deazaguanine synthase QueC [Armatimonadota bacterium]